MLIMRPAQRLTNGAVISRMKPAQATRSIRASVSAASAAVEGLPACILLVVDAERGEALFAAHDSPRRPVNWR